MLYQQFDRLFGHVAETGNRNPHYCMTQIKDSYTCYTIVQYKFTRKNYTITT